MSIVIAPLTNGSVMSAPAVRARLETIRVFTNEGMIGTDMTGKFKSRHFVRPESYGSPNPRTKTASGTNWYGREGGAPVDRAVATLTSFGADSWRYVWGAVREIHAPEDDYLVEIVASIWAWHIGTNTYIPEDPGTYDDGYPARLCIGVDGDSKDYTERPIYDSGTDPSSLGTNVDNGSGINYSAGPYRYGGRNITFCAKVRLDSGRHVCGVMGRMQDFTSSGDEGKLYMGARGCLVEGYRR